MDWVISYTKNLDNFEKEIFEMYYNSYKDIGIIDFGGWEVFKEYLNCSCYLLMNKEQELNGIILYWLSDYGNKISLVISKTPDIAKKYIIPKLKELLETNGYYAELSDALEYIIRKNGLDNIKDKKIIKLLTPTLNDEDIFDESDKRCYYYTLNKKYNIPSPSGSYLREIKGIGIHRKALYGLPCLNKKFNNKCCNRICINHNY
jgi:hypothetical protein